MKSIGEIMKEMGFNANAPFKTQKAFFKHLIQDADSKQLNRKETSKTKAKDHPAQMEFDISNGKKVS